MDNPKVSPEEAARLAAQQARMDASQAQQNLVLVGILAAWALGAWWLFGPTVKRAVKHLVK